MKHVTGPGDVTAGDLVEFSDLNTYRPKHMVGTVVKATAKRMTVKVGDEVFSAAYRYTQKCKIFRRTEVRSGYRFQRLWAIDRWRRECPTTTMLDYGNGKISFKTEDLATNQEHLLGEIHAVRVWLTKRPGDDAP